MKAISLGYHDVTDGCDLPPHKKLYSLEKPHFQDHLTAIQRNAPAKSVATIEASRSWKGEIPIFLTFDDGAASAFTFVADELEMRGWRGHFFVITDWIGRPGYLDRHQICELSSRGHVIGSHTCSHPERMSSLTWNELIREWSQSCNVLADILGREVRVASVANGYYSHAVGQTAMASGIQVLFTSTPTAGIRRFGGNLILGRFSMQRRTPPEVAGALARHKIGPRLRQAATWYPKEAIKTLAGEQYFRIRRLVISGIQSWVT
jgi:peptidoglycan/xylan/chitin deacetylase (PgdA/CDA1 family)